MFPIFPEERAFEICTQLITYLDSGNIRIHRISRVSKEREGQGIMLGVLVCEDKNGNEIVLHTISGLGKKLVYKKHCKGKNTFFVEPIVPLKKIEKALAKNDKKIHILTEKINKLKLLRKIENGKSLNITQDESSLVHERSVLTLESLNKVYDLYVFNCADKVKRSLKDICISQLPPTGTGDCCAPKLLNYAFSHKLRPISMCEVFYGKSNSFKENAKTYPPCDERCALILPAMLGLEILYRDSEIIVVNKQSGLLSVPGRGENKQDCIVNRVKRLFTKCINQPSVHRLDMETSGLMVLAFTENAQRNLSKQFEDRLVKKEYTALLDGKLTEENGLLELYFRLDVENRPHQIWDAENGKKAVTEWKKLCEEDYIFNNTKKKVTRVLFIPHTGRTHQLRLASADSHGLSHPIIGDSLYGKCNQGERLMLHAHYLSFTHPATGEKMVFYSKVPF